MTGLLIMVHGSPRESANRPILALADQLRISGTFDRVAVGFMECNRPTIPEAVQQLVGEGIGRIVALPYFLHTGVHVTHDLPGLLNTASAEHPEVEFYTTEFLGCASTLTAILADRAKTTGC